MRGSRGSWVATGSFVSLCGFLAVGPLPAQQTLDRSPNLSGAWVGADGTVYFHFLHRFQIGDPPTRKVFNSPTFLLAASPGSGTLFGIQYATSSDVAPEELNEFELFGRTSPLRQDAGAALDIGVTGGYNLAAQSADGELSVARRFGPLRLLAAARAFSDGYGASEARGALAGGASLRLTRSVALAGDVASLFDRRDGEELAWGVGVQLVIPYTPHTISIQAANTTTATLQGASRGKDQVWYGFEFTIPITLARYFGSRAAAGAAQPETAAAGEAVVVDIQGLQFRPARLEVEAGTTVVWANRDEVAHTSTAGEGEWDSGLIEPGQSWSRTFDRPGTYPYHCTLHPFMTGAVIVR